MLGLGVVTTVYVGDGVALLGMCVAVIYVDG
jgi:hypothetical protein